MSCHVVLEHGIKIKLAELSIKLTRMAKSMTRSTGVHSTMGDLVIDWAILVSRILNEASFIFIM